MDPETAQLIGRLTATVDGNTHIVGELSAALRSLTETMTDQRLDMQRYWSGLEKANDDIREMRRTNIQILTRLDNAVSQDQFQKLEEHVKTLNGTDTKFKALGINIGDPASVEEWRDILLHARNRRRMASGVRLRVLQGLALTLTIALAASAWKGIREGVFSHDEPQRKEYTQYPVGELKE